MRQQRNWFAPYREQTGMGGAHAETPLKKKIKGLLALGLCLCLGLGLLPAPALAAAPTTNWLDAGNYDDTWYNETDTEFTLTTAKQLAGLADLVDRGNIFTGKTVKLGADIDLSAHLWTPMGYRVSSSFNGTFDGGGKTVSGLILSETDDCGLFYSVGGEGTVHSLRVMDAVVTDSGGGANCYYSILAKENYGTIYDCVVSGSVNFSETTSSDSNMYIGGLAGENHGTVKNSSAQLTSVTVTSALSFNISIGGIASRGSGTVENCFADADTVTVSVAGATTKQYRIAPTASYSYWDGTTQLTDSGTPTYTQCYAVTAEQIAGTGNAIIGASSTHANTPSLLTALNNWTAANTGYISWNLKEGVPLPSIFAPVYIDLGVVPEQDKDSATGTLDADVQLHGQVQENVQLISVTLPATIPFILDVDNAGALKRVLSGTGTLTNRSDMGVTVTLTSVTDPDSLLGKVDLSLVPDPAPAGVNVALTVGTGKTDVLSTLAAQAGGVPATSTLKVDGAAKAGVPSVGGDGDTFTVGLTLKVSKT